MLTIEQCRKHILDIELDDEKIQKIRDYLYALSLEIIRKSIVEYERQKTSKKRIQN